jgi:hypothetical protein
MMRKGETPEGEMGWTFYHDSFRQHLLRAETVRDNREWAEETWLQECEQWRVLREESLRRYALRHYATHLEEAKRWEELYVLARDEDYGQAQQQALIEEPERPLLTMQTAITGAAAADDAGAMAEFMLGHALRLREMHQESPLEALRAGSLKRAWRLADLKEMMLCTIWYLLLIWELKEDRRLEEAEKSLERLAAKELIRLSDWQEKYAGCLMFETYAVNCKLAEEVRIKILGGEGNVRLVQNLIKERYFAEARQAAQDIGGDEVRANALIEVAKAEAAAGMMAEARASFAQARQAALGTTYKQAEVLREVAKAAAAAGLIDEAKQTAHTIKDEVERAAALCEVAKAAAKAGSIDEVRASLREAKQTAQSIVNASKRAEVLREVAKAEAEAGLMAEAAASFAEARQAAQTIGDEDERANALIDVAKAEVAGGFGSSNSR